MGCTCRACAIRWLARRHARGEEPFTVTDDSALVESRAAEAASEFPPLRPSLFSQTTCRPMLSAHAALPDTKFGHHEEECCERPGAAPLAFDLAWNSASHKPNCPARRAWSQIVPDRDTGK